MRPEPRISRTLSIVAVLAGVTLPMPLAAAELLGWQDDVGTIQPGHWADIVGVSGDPLEDITELQRTMFVMKGGEVIVIKGPRLST